MGLLQWIISWLVVLAVAVLVSISAAGEPSHFRDRPQQVAANELKTGPLDWQRSERRAIQRAGGSQWHRSGPVSFSPIHPIRTIIPANTGLSQSDLVAFTHRLRDGIIDVTNPARTQVTPERAIVVRIVTVRASARPVNSA